jgi:transposase
MKKLIMRCAGIDTGKRNLDVALDSSAARLRAANTADGHTRHWLAAAA